MTLKQIIGLVISIKLVLATIITGAVWAADTRYVTNDKAKQAEIRQLRRQIQDLEIQKGYADNARRIQMFEARIAVKENQIKQIQGE